MEKKLRREQKRSLHAEITEGWTEKVPEMENSPRQLWQRRTMGKIGLRRQKG